MVSAKQEERRQTPRVLVRVLVDFESSDTYLYDYSNDLSEGGIFIETDKPLDVGLSLTLRFTLPNVDYVFEAKGKIAWINKEGKEGKLIAPHLAKGMGVEFLEIENSDRKRIQEYIAGTLEEKK